MPVFEPGDIVVMDNLGSHKSTFNRQMIRAAGARLWYVPWMRGRSKRTIEDTRLHIGHPVSAIEPAECTT